MIHNPISSFNLYHGTTLDNLSKILETKEFVYKPRIDHWLGNGVYFFVDDIDKAVWWSRMATNLSDKPLEDRGIILIKDYRIKRNKLLDLDTEKDRSLLVNFLKDTPMRMKVELESKEPEKRIIEARAKIINFLVDYYRMSAVKYTFHKNNIQDHSVLDELGLSNNETQFCIIDTDTINFKNVYDVTEEVI